eukprot:741295-Hanusia_phi.AAC.4
MGKKLLVPVERRGSMKLSLYALYNVQQAFECKKRHSCTSSNAAKHCKRLAKPGEAACSSRRYYHHSAPANHPNLTVGPTCLTSVTAIRRKSKAPNALTWLSSTRGARDHDCQLGIFGSPIHETQGSDFSAPERLPTFLESDVVLSEVSRPKNKR